MLIQMPALQMIEQTFNFQRPQAVLSIKWKIKYHLYSFLKRMLPTLHEVIYVKEFSLLEMRYTSAFSILFHILPQWLTYSTLHIVFCIQ